MGDAPPQPGFIRREGENFPPIPSYLLELPTEKLFAERERFFSALSAETGFILPNSKTEGNLEDILFLYDAAIAAVGRQQEAPVQR